MLFSIVIIFKTEKADHENQLNSIFFSFFGTAAAIDNFNMSEMLSLVEDLGGWPSLNSTWNEDNYNWMVPAAASTIWYPRVHDHLIPRGNLFGVKPDRDFEDTSKYILYVSWRHLIRKK